jgi:hypothetical protein
MSLPVLLSVLDLVPVSSGSTAAQALRNTATGADEPLVTTITHGHEDRVRSYELLARAWAKQG